jgi:hypothetical protein
MQTKSFSSALEADDFENICVVPICVVFIQL